MTAATPFDNVISAAGFVLPPAAVPPEDNFHKAIRRWKEVMGAEHVLDSDAIRDKYSQCTLPVSTRPRAIVRPSCREEVQAFCQIAQEFGTPYHAISRGKNWGYGDACAPTDGQVIVDLGRMNRIVEVNEELAYMVVEPGVTQGQLYDYFVDHNLPFMVPTHGGGPDCSILGNAMQRGYGITPIEDHFAALTSLEAVLPNGDLYKSPLANLVDGPLPHLFKWGVGPYTDGLFTQSKLGVVTQASFTIRKRPEVCEAFIFSIKPECNLGEAGQAVKRVLEKLGGIVGGINLMNQLRVLSMVTDYPHNEVPTGQTISQELLKKISAREGISPWTGAGCLYGERTVTRAARQILKQELRTIADRVVFFDSKKIERLRWLSHWLPAKLGISKQLKGAENLLAICSGEPRRFAHGLTKWITPNAELSSENSPGLIWYSPLVPNSKQTLGEFATNVDAVCREHGLEPLITLTSLSPQVFDSTIPLLFSTKDQKSGKRSFDGLEALSQTNSKLGCIPYRNMTPKEVHPC